MNILDELIETTTQEDYIERLMTPQEMAQLIQGLQDGIEQ